MVAVEYGVYVYRDLSDADKVVEAIEDDVTLDVVGSQLRKVKYESIREKLAPIYFRSAMERAHRPYVESGRAVLLPEGCTVLVQKGFNTPSGSQMVKVEVTGGEHMGFIGYSYAHDDTFDENPSQGDMRLANEKAANRQRWAKEQQAAEEKAAEEYQKRIASEREAARIEELQRQHLELQRQAEYEETAKREAIQEGIDAEEREAERLYATGWVGNGRDGRTIDELMFQGEWKYPKQARAAMERAKAQEEANLRRHYANDPKRLSDLLSSFESAKTNRNRRMREEIEYQKLRARNPERYPDQYKHFFYPGEIKAWQKTQDAVGSEVSRTTEPAEAEKRTTDQVAKAQVARVQAESEAARKEHPEKTPPPNTEHRVEVTTKSFLARFIESGGAETPDEVVACYAELVDYYDQGQRTRDQIRQDATEHFGKWPKRSYRLVGEPQIARESATKEVITCDVAFEVSDGKRRIEGVAQNSITLDVETMKIVSIREKVVKRRTTAINK
jgi:hypothetical protein